MHSFGRMPYWTGLLCTVLSSLFRVRFLAYEQLPRIDDFGPYPLRPRNLFPSTPDTVADSDASTVACCDESFLAHRLL